MTDVVHVDDIGDGPAPFDDRSHPGGRNRPSGRHLHPKSRASPPRFNTTAYPAVLLTAGEHDTRVDAWHAKKMAARLQAATSSERPVVLRLESSGHLAGSLDQLGLGNRPVAVG